jgi:hypothetical protein
MKKGSSVILIILFIIFNYLSAYTQTRVAVLPFQNLYGLLTLNTWSYDLQDSLLKSLKEQDPEEKFYRIIPYDSIEVLLAELNLDPTNPQYPTDMWKVVKKLNAQLVVMGSFNIEAKRYLINCYIFNIETKLANPKYQAKDIFKKEKNIMDAIPIIVDRLVPGLKGEK